ncbi:hypothetical protein [Metabacillus fastidiosus]|uniref:hypothetical protein n=1 Tax=Metabacillus fastidiosus TaxID=1458 RepID=UPI003D2C128E
MRIIVFKYTRGFNDIVEEEVEFENDVTEEEINKEFESWVWERVIGDHVTWYEKE